MHEAKLVTMFSEKIKTHPSCIRPTTLIWASTDRHMTNSFFRLWASSLYTDLSPQCHRVSILLRDTGAIEVIILIHSLRHRSRPIWEFKPSAQLELFFNPLSPHDALKHHFTSLKTDLIFYNQGFLDKNFHETGLKLHGNFYIFFHPLQIIFIHYKSRIVIAIRSL